MKTFNKICLWCGNSTDGTSVAVERKGEHIFPESIGGNSYLPVGSVCKECNNSLGRLDQELRYGHPAMMDAYQVDPTITGKKISGRSERKLRKKADRIKEKNEIIKGSDGSLIIREPEENKSKFYKANYNSASELFLRGLYKCLANILCYAKGTSKTRELYPELIKFVNEGGQKEKWNYALSLANPFNRIPMSSPNQLFVFDKPNSRHLFLGFMHTSGIWILGTEPFGINEDIIKYHSDEILLITQKWMDVNPRIFPSGITSKAEDYFGSNIFIDKHGIGKLYFHLGIHDS